MNYLDRSIKSSVKNFQLTDSSKPDKEDILLQFGEIKTENNFIIDYKSPFSPIQAFGIGISCIQKKMACE